MSRHSVETPFPFAGVASTSRQMTRATTWSLRSVEWLVPLLVMNLLVIGLALAIPGIRATWLQDDEYLETVTVAAFGLAALVGCWSALMSRPRLRLEWFVPAFAMFCLLEESSYGERLVGLDMPCIAGVKVDTAHDVVELAYTALKQQGVSKTQMAAGMAFCGLVVGGVVLRHRAQWHRWTAPWLGSMPLRLTAIAAFCCLAAVLLNLKANSTRTRMLEESLEFNASLLMVFATTRMARVGQSPASIPLQECPA